MVISFGTADELVELVLLRRKSSSWLQLRRALSFYLRHPLTHGATMGGDVPRRTPDSLVFGDLSKDVFCVLIVYSCRSVGVCREVFRVRVRLYVCEQILQQ